MNVNGLTGCSIFVQRHGYEVVRRPARRPKIRALLLGGGG
jgi:hypothetical protein